MQKITGGPLRFWLYVGAAKSDHLVNLTAEDRGLTPAITASSDGPIPMRFIALVIACTVLGACAHPSPDASSKNAAVSSQRVGHLESH